MIGPLCAATTLLGALLWPFVRHTRARYVFAALIALAFAGFLVAVWHAAPTAMDYRPF